MACICEEQQTLPSHVPLVHLGPTVCTAGEKESISGHAVVSWSALMASRGRGDVAKVHRHRPFLYIHGDSPRWIPW